MRILWHGIGPWHKTAYGQLTALFVPRLAQLGHEVGIAVMGRRGVDDNPARAHPDSVLHTGQWQGHELVLPPVCGDHPHGQCPEDCWVQFALPRPAAIREAFGGRNPDLVLVLKDPWVLTPDSYLGFSTAVWVNIDCKPLGVPDAGFFRASGARPIAVSRFGLSMLRAAGFSDALYVPHGIDPAVWTPGDRGEARDLLGLPRDAYIAGINAANIGPRKAWGEQFAAFAAYRKMHPKQESLLLVHATPDHREGINLYDLADHLGILGSVKFGSGGNMTPAQMVTWYRSLDDLLACSYGEGFGMPIAEALACGIPVIGTDCSAITEKILPGCGYLVSGQQWWHPQFRAWWTIPRIGEITAKMARRTAPVPEEYRGRYDANMITRDYWKPILEELLP